MLKLDVDGGVKLVIEDDLLTSPGFGGAGFGDNEDFFRRRRRQSW